MYFVRDYFLTYKYYEINSLSLFLNSLMLVDYYQNTTYLTFVSCFACQNSSTVKHIITVKTLSLLLSFYMNYRRSFWTDFMRPA